MRFGPFHTARLRDVPIIDPIAPSTDRRGGCKSRKDSIGAFGDHRALQSGIAYRALGGVSHVRGARSRDLIPQECGITIVRDRAFWQGHSCSQRPAADIDLPHARYEERKTGRRKESVMCNPTLYLYGL